MQGGRALLASVERGEGNTAMGERSEKALAAPRRGSTTRKRVGQLNGP